MLHGDDSRLTSETLTAVLQLSPVENKLVCLLTALCSNSGEQGVFTVGFTQVHVLQVSRGLAYSLLRIRIGGCVFALRILSLSSLQGREYSNSTTVRHTCTSPGESKLRSRPDFFFFLTSAAQLNTCLYLYCIDFCIYLRIYVSIAMSICVLVCNSCLMNN